MLCWRQRWEKTPTSTQPTRAVIQGARHTTTTICALTTIYGIAVSSKSEEMHITPTKHAFITSGKTQIEWNWLKTETVSLFVVLSVLMFPVFVLIFINCLYICHFVLLPYQFFTSVKCSFSSSSLYIIHTTYQMLHLPSKSVKVFSHIYPTWEDGTWYFR